MNHGFKFCKASEGSLIMMSEVVFTGISSVLIFKDAVTANFLVGALLILGSGIGLNLMGGRFRSSKILLGYEVRESAGIPGADGRSIANPGAGPMA
jgi:hypothetical protein